MRESHEEIVVRDNDLEKEFPWSWPKAGTGWWKPSATGSIPCMACSSIRRSRESLGIKLLVNFLKMIPK